MSAKLRGEQFLLSDNIAVVETNGSLIETETSFTNVNQIVEKTEIDIFDTLIGK